MTVRHVRVGGWCDDCGGHGKASIQHLDSPVPKVVVDVLLKIQDAVIRSGHARMDELDRAGHGCEATAARTRVDGALMVVYREMWQALGFPEPADGEAYPWGQAYFDEMGPV